MRALLFNQQIFLKTFNCLIGEKLFFAVIISGGGRKDFANENWIEQQINAVEIFGLHLATNDADIWVAKGRREHSFDGYIAVKHPARTFP